LFRSSLGVCLPEILDNIAEGKGGGKTDSGVPIKIGVTSLPSLPKDVSDRNRTSPFAFTGNKFEFRMVGSSQSIATPNTFLNVAVAQVLSEFADKLESLPSGNTAKEKEKAIFEVVKKYINESAAIRFDGNGYSDEWKAEAAKRGLDCETSVPLIFDNDLTKQSVKMFTDVNVFNEKELHSRCEVKWETYTKKIQIESRVLGDLALNHIVPVATEYQSRLIDNVSKIATLFSEDQSKAISAQNRLLIERIANHTNEISLGVDNMVNERKNTNKIESEREKAIAYHDQIVPLMETIRYHIDKLELIVDNQMWPLPKYRELLFIR